MATSVWFSRPVREITDIGTIDSSTKVSPMPVITALGRRSGAWLKPRAISGTMYWAEKQNTAMLNTGTMYTQSPSSRRAASVFSLSRVATTRMRIMLTMPTPMNFSPLPMAPRPR
ncbi:hypothetical protein D3C78_1161770 [compost metagenome]